MAIAKAPKDFLSKVEFARDAVLFEEGTDAAVFFVIEGGLVQLSKLVHTQRCGLGTLGIGDVIGEEAFFPEAKYGYSAIAVESTRCLRVVGAQFEEMVRRSPEIAIRLMRKLALRLVHSQFRLANFTLRAPLARLMHQLLAEADRAGSANDVPIPYDLPDVLALERGALDEMMRVLMRERLLAAGEKPSTFTIADRSGFQRYLAFLELRDRFERLAGDDTP